MQSKCDKYDEMERRCAKMQHECDTKIQEMKNSLVANLIEEITKPLYIIDREYIKKPKCNKCDEDRKIWYKTPSGKDAYEYCDCNDSTIHFFVKEQGRERIYDDKFFDSKLQLRKIEVGPWKIVRAEEKNTGDNMIFDEKFHDGNKPSVAIDFCDYTFFIDKKIAQEWADKLNKMFS